MSCFRPNVMRARVDPGTGSIVWTFEGAAGLDNPLEYGSIDNLSIDGQYRAIVPCGRCLGCRIDYSREWANRMCIELDDNPHAVFVTLTYNNDHLPRTESGCPTLDKRDLQLFWKRLRKSFPGRRIRYYVAGEYGPRTLRPHYHAIIYGLSLADFGDLRYDAHNELQQPFYRSDRLASIWLNGYILLSEVSYKTCAYVARYVLKKHYGTDKRLLGDAIPEFSLCSRRPGIGLLHATDYVLSGNNIFPLSTASGVVEVSLPKAFVRHAKSDKSLSPEDLDKVMIVCYDRSKDAYERLASHLRYTDKTYYDFLRSKESNLAGKIKLLPERGDL
ncbi:VP4 [Gokushovirus WZ-2015a]|nr:VP4 [Gokushovirus WZ-2015a]ALS03546.1 VP4 [Gokushovirus WZ-2015a]